MSVLPEFAPEGVLPPGVHNASWDEVVGRFGSTPRRQRLLDGLCRAGQNLREAGVKVIWLGGSFVTAKPNPNDFDGVWDPSHAKIGDVDPILVDAQDLRKGRYRQKAKYGGELFVGIEMGSGLAFQRFLQEDQNGNTKGIVRLDLRTLP